ncbi:MAG TPA: hypothetical protein VFK20_12490 [Vicinamibacterales bacterium]|nr:hypothetical protein [Vicinamibacterales bacterium]
MHAVRRRGAKPESRILYWYRTPPGVRVGRPPLDEEAIRLLEANNPQVQFDWNRILKAPPSQGQEGRTAPAPKRRERREPSSRRASDGRRESPVPSSRPEPPQIRKEVVVSPDELIDEPVDVAIEEPVDAAIEAYAADRPISPAEARVGAEGLARLRARYAELMARITARGGEPPAVEELRARAERLNPDGWLTDEDVREALEQYESVFDSIRSQVGPPRHRRRRRSGPPSPV